MKGQSSRRRTVPEKCVDDGIPLLQQGPLQRLPPRTGTGTSPNPGLLSVNKFQQLQHSQKPCLALIHFQYFWRTQTTWILDQEFSGGELPIGILCPKHGPPILHIDGSSCGPTDPKLPPKNSQAPAEGFLKSPKPPQQRPLRPQRPIHGPQSMGLS